MTVRNLKRSLSDEENEIEGLPVKSQKCQEVDSDSEDQLSEDNKDSNPRPERPENYRFLSRSQRKRIKRKILKFERKELNAKPAKPVKVPPHTSTVSLPEGKGEDLSDLLATIKQRICLQNSNSLIIKPVPKHCSIAILKDLCPMLMSAHLPTKRSARYAFLVFKSSDELNAAQKYLEDKSLDGKKIKVEKCSRIDDKVEEKTLENFDLTELVVLNLARQTSRFDLGQIFGKAQSVNIATLSDKSCAGSCIMKYRNEEEAIEEFKKCHRAYIRHIPIYVNFRIKNFMKDSEIELDEKDFIKEKPKDKSMTVHESLKTLDPIEFAKSSKSNSAKKGNQQLHSYQRQPKNSMKTKPKSKKKSKK